jgi:uncharacterized protein (TIGR00369 family)
MTPAKAVPVDDGRCIGCGPDAPHGLHMRFAVGHDKSVEATVVVPAGYQGWRDVVHGGVVALLLDEAMAYAAGAHGELGMTADLKMRFRKSVPVGAPLTVRANVTWRRRNVLGIAASVHDASGTLLASGEGSFVSQGRLEPGRTFGYGTTTGLGVPANLG